MTALLQLRGVTAAYDAIEVLHDIDLEGAPGTVVAVLGPNGAGKTTLLNVVAGLHPPSGGSVTPARHRIDRVRADALARAGVCLVLEGRGIFANLTVAEHLRMATHSGRSMRDIEEETYARFPRLQERRTQLAGTMSGGEQQMLALARGLAADPALLLLDELSMGLAPLIVEELYGQVAAIASTGVSIVVVEQFAHAVLGVADRAAILVNGRIQAIGTPAEIEGDLSSAYLGARPPTPVD